MTTEIFVITTPDNIGVSLVESLEKAGYNVTHSMYDWNSEKGKATVARLSLPQGKLPLEYEALKVSSVLVADLECDPALLAEFMALAVMTGLPSVGVFQISPQPSKFSSWFEALVPHSKLIGYLGGLTKPMQDEMDKVGGNEDDSIC